MTEQIAQNTGFEDLFQRAAELLPEGLDEAEAAAWTGQKVLSLIEEERAKRKANQVLLAVYLYESDIWRAHPKGYENFRDYLSETGMSKSGVSDAVAMATVIMPKCAELGIAVNPLVTMQLWGRLRQGIPALRQALELGDEDTVHAILSDVKELPSSAIAEKYRQHRAEKYAEAEVLKSPSGKTVIVVVVDSNDAQAAKAAIGKFAEWGVVTATSKSNGVLTMGIS